MSGTTCNIKDDRGHTCEKNKRSMSLQRCNSVREETTQKNKRSMSLHQCTSEREDMSEKKERNTYLERCISRREDTPKKKKRSISLARCTSEHTVFCGDLFLEILIRLPTKSLYRCKCVCKSWRSLISEDNFFNHFITKCKSLPPLLSGMFCGKDKIEGIDNFPDMVTDFLDLSTLKNMTSLVDPLPVDICCSFLNRDILAVSAHNGFVLFRERPEKGTCHTTFYYRYNYVVCNPLTKQYVDLPKPRCLHGPSETFLFSYNKKGSSIQQIEFKVVSLLNRFQEYASKVELYSSETGKWKLCSIFHDEHKSNDVTFMFNECVYFWGRSHLFSYDVMEETMKKVVLPPNASPSGRFGVSDGSLYFAGYSASSFWVFVLVDGVGWDLVHTVEFASLASMFPDMSSCYLFWPLAFHPLNHELVVVSTASTQCLYHTGTGNIKSIEGCRPIPIHLVISYSLPAWLPCLPNTLRHAKPAGSARKRMTKCSKARLFEAIGL